jgi:cytochrome P450
LLGLGALDRLRRDFLGHAVDLERRYGDAVYFRVGLTPLYQFTHPDQVHEVFVTKARSFYKTKRLKQVFGRWNGNGLLLNEGESWARQRRMMQPAFHPHRLKTYADLIVRRAEQLVTAAGDDEFDVAADLNRLTLLTVAEALFGAEVSDVADRFIQEVATLQRIAIRDFTLPFLLPLWVPTAKNRRLAESIRFLDDLVLGVIARRRRSGEDRGDLLSLMLSAVDEEGGGGTMTDRQLRDESVNLILAGNETTATALSWAVYLLSEHPDVQDKLRAEIDAVLAGRSPTADDVEHLPYTAQVIDEAMRLYPPVYATSRAAIEPVEIGGYPLPRGAQVNLVPYITHRDPRWFDDPESFRPERFAPDAPRPIPAFAYYPFGAGPRACIGKGFALMEAVLVLATVASRHEIRLGEGQGRVEMETQVSLHPKGGLRVRLVPRKAAVT